MAIDVSKLEIVKAPNEILRKVCEEIASFDDVKEISEKMTSLMKQNNGIGLAANQAGLSIRLFVMQLEKMKKPKVFINPKIIHGCVPVLGEEGCLSEPGIKQSVTRNQYILLEYTDLSGKRIKENMKDLEARCAQHEIEHLNGILISDYAK